MKYIFCIFILLYLSYSCKNERYRSNGSNDPIEVDAPTKIKKLAKLELLKSLSKDSVMDYFDLSNDSISVFPDLSEYTIKSLNLSFNQLDTIMVKYLPKRLEKLDGSNNQLRKINVLYKSLPFLKELNVSYNQIKKIFMEEPLYRIIASHNDLIYIDLDHRNIQYLDISFNPHFKSKVSFYPSRIDTIVQEGTADDEPIYNPEESPFGYDISMLKYTPDSISKKVNRLFCEVTYEKS